MLFYIGNNQDSDSHGPDRFTFVGAQFLIHTYSSGTAPPHNPLSTFGKPALDYIGNAFENTTPRFMVDGDGNVGIGTGSPDYKLSINNGGMILINNQGNFGSGSRISITNSVLSNEIHGNGGGSKGYDVGFLRLSAGGGSSVSHKSYIDLYGYTKCFNVDGKINKSFVSGKNE